MAATTPAARDAMVKAFHGAPNSMQMLLATQLSGSAAGSATLLDAVGQGAAPAAVLFDSKIADRLASNVPDAPAKIKQLTRGLAAPSQAIQATIDQRVGQFRFFRPSPERGAAVFAKTCAVCHSIDGHGAVVGPQLDGIGNRGADRVVEDVLDPNRNVDPAFRYSIVHLADGSVITGLLRRDNGDTLTFIDPTAKEITVHKSQIAKRSESKSSLMPSNFADMIPLTDFYDLLSFLLQHKSTK
jgi:putative heme-binding domain-containing protein